MPFLPKDKVSKTLVKLIFEEIDNALLKEQAAASPPAPEETAPPADTSTAPDMADMGADPGMDASAPVDGSTGLDPAASGGAGGSSLPDAGGAPGGAGADADGDGLADEEGGGGDFGGGGGFGALGGGGGGFGGGGGMGDDGGGDDMDSDGDEEGTGPTPSGEPVKNADDPVGAAVEEATKMAEQTTEIQKIVNAVKASIQVNFSNYEEAWPIVEKLRETGDKTLDAVADRLSLFIAGVLEEGTGSKGRTMKITKENLKEMIRAIVKEKVAASGFKHLSSSEEPEGNEKEETSEATTGTSGTVDAAKKPQTPQQKRAAMKATTRGIELNEEDEVSNKVQISESQLKALVKEVVRRKLQETTGYVEQERMRQEMNMLALEFLEKLTQKLNIDAGSLSPEALETYKRIHKQLEMSVRQAAADMYQLGVVVSTAADGSGGTGNSGKPGV